VGVLQGLWIMIVMSMSSILLYAFLRQFSNRLFSNTHQMKIKASSITSIGSITVNPLVDENNIEMHHHSGGLSISQRSVIIEKDPTVN
jgi:hypothetical protein